jgi:Flp pilus assembly pilin Flp
VEIGWKSTKPVFDKALGPRASLVHLKAVLPFARKGQGLEEQMSKWIRNLWSKEEAQDIAEYAVMLAVILVLVVGTIRLIGGNANNAFSATASSISQ